MRPIFVMLVTLMPLLAIELVAQTGASGPLGLDAPRLTEAPAGTPLTGAHLDRRTAEVADRLRCPSCQALSVADSPTDSSQAIRQEIRELLAAGYSEEQVMLYFERSYGEFIRLAPKATGFNLVVWLAPILALLGGLALVIFRLRSARTGSSEKTNEPEADLAPYLERVRRESQQ